MKIVPYQDIPEMCDQLLHEVETSGITVEVSKDGKPIARMVPVDEATKLRFEAENER